MQSQVEIKHIESDANPQASFSVMKELRPHLSDCASYGAQVGRQRAQGYRLLAHGATALSSGLPATGCKTTWYTAGTSMSMTWW